jgi:hypothetical protein
MSLYTRLLLRHPVCRDVEARFTGGKESAVSNFVLPTLRWIDGCPLAHAIDGVRVVPGESLDREVVY